ncbi:MAG: deoxynucleoside kinase [Bacteroidales bacterium]|nr:deoxynucleoside kinase [Bacteroidales bacterium]
MDNNYKYKYIVIEGSIGVGKTSLATKIAKDYNAKLVLEQFAENPFLPKFYKDPDRFSFPLELSFLADRYQQLKKEMINPDLFYSFIIADYYFMKSLIFAGRTLEDDEYNLYRQLFLIIYESIPRPDLYVYLQVDTNKLLENIKKRGRDYEQNITADYLNRIQKGYFEFFSQNPNLRFLIIDVNELDFVSNQNDYQRLLDTIFSFPCNLGMNRVKIEK